MIGQLVAGALIAASVPVTQPATDCDNSFRQYTLAAQTVLYSVKRYLKCIELSGARDDCSLEFRRMKNAQLEYESAVSIVGSRCRE